MRERLKQFGIRVLLLVTKSFVYLWKAITKNTPRELTKAFRAIGRSTMYGLLFVLSPFYQVYLRIKRILVDLYEHPSPWLKPLSHRYSLHLLIIVVAGVAVYANISSAQTAENFGAGRLVLQLVQNSETYDVGSTLPSETQTVPTSPTEDTSPQPLLSYTGEAAFQPYLPTTENSVALRQHVEEYIVHEGDTPAGIAVKFRIQLSTLLQANNLTARSLIRPGQKLTILPIDGVLHTVKRGETAGSIAKQYQVSADSILTYNRLPTQGSLALGQTLIIPGGTPPATPAPRPRPTPPPETIARTPVPSTPAIDLGTKLLWPTVSHRINQYFTYRHFGVDIHGVIGAPIYAAESGVVVESRWAGGYGNMTLIKHDNGLYTRYGHAIKNLTVPGQRVERGEVIALLGSTGNSTGPHVHFEVLIGSQHVNPLAYTR